MIRLGVGIGAVAAMRATLGSADLDLAAVAHACRLGGADHLVLRCTPDGPTRDGDVTRVCGGGLPVWLAMEPTTDLVAMACRAQPAGVLLTPRPTQAGDVEQAAAMLREAGRQVAVVVSTDEDALVAAMGVGIEHVVLDTNPFATATTADRRVDAFRALARAAATARALMLRVSAGGGLGLLDATRVARLPEVEAVLVGRAIVARAIFEGLTRATEAFSRRLGAIEPLEGDTVVTTEGGA